MLRVIGLILLVSSWQLQAFAPNAAVKAARAARGTISKNISDSAQLRALFEQLRGLRAKSQLAVRNNADNKGIFIGIDLGTTNSVVSIVSEADDATPKVLNIAAARNLTPSVVQFDEAGNVASVGDAAVNASINDPANTIFSVKRFIGSSYEDALKEINIDDLPYKVVRGANGRASIELSSGVQIQPEQVSAEVLASLRSVVEKQFPDQEIKRVVITIPERFINDQRQATIAAAELAGFPAGKVDFVNEPTAAAVSYGLDASKEGEKVIVYDLGGGTTDIALLEITDNDFNTLITRGNTALGGDNIDEKIVKTLKERVEADAGFELNAQGMDMLRKQAVQAKHDLSDAEQVALTVTAFGNGGFKAVPVSLTRAELETMIADFIGETDKLLKEVLEETTAKKLSALTPDEIDQVVFVGGTTRIPAFKEQIAKLFPNSGLHFGENPDEAVSLGASIYAKGLSTVGSDLSVQTQNNIPIGIRLGDGRFFKIYKEGEQIPGKASGEGLHIDGRRGELVSNVEVDVYQGTRERAADNKALGKFNADIGPSKALEDTFTVDMELDRNGIVTVTMRNDITGVQDSAKITGSTRLNAEEIARMQGDMKLNEAEDAMIAELGEQANEFQAAINLGKDLLSRPNVKLSDATRSEAEELIAQVDALAKVNFDELQGVDAITKEIEKITAETKKMSDLNNKMVNESRGE
ncbi:MAG: Hsp70 family protein [Pseudomonadota bacterium]|nr:Hsp70 family protein [Pseudomonadota bacterium]